MGRKLGSYMEHLKVIPGSMPKKFPHEQESDLKGMTLVLYNHDYIDSAMLEGWCHKFLSDSEIESPVPGDPAAPALTK